MSRPAEMMAISDNLLSLIQPILSDERVGFTRPCVNGRRCHSTTSPRRLHRLACSALPGVAVAVLRFPLLASLSYPRLILGRKGLPTLP